MRKLFPRKAVEKWNIFDGDWHGCFHSQSSHKIDRVTIKKSRVAPKHLFFFCHRITLGHIDAKGLRRHAVAINAIGA